MRSRMQYLTDLVTWGYIRFSTSSPTQQYLFVLEVGSRRRNICVEERLWSATALHTRVRGLYGLAGTLDIFLLGFGQ